MPKISVIVPVYNVEKYFERCSRSLFNQTLDDIEYIFVDDCTPDKSFEILSQLLTEFPNRKNSVKILKMTTNSKQAAVRQAGLEVASGEYVIHCDPDDWIDLNYYENLYLKASETHSDVVIGDYIVHEEGGCNIECINYNYKQPIDIILNDKCFFTSLCMTLISRKLIEDNRIRFYPGINCMEDQGFISRVLYYANKVEFTHSSFYHYNKGNQESITHFLKTPDVVEQRIKCLKLIDDFYLSKGISPLKLGLSLRVKRDIKDQFLSLETLSQWRHIFPDVIHWEWKNSDASWFYKTCYFLSHKVGLWPMKLYLSLYKRIK